MSSWKACHHQNGLRARWNLRRFWSPKSLVVHRDSWPGCIYLKSVSPRFWFWGLAVSLRLHSLFLAECRQGAGVGVNLKALRTIRIYLESILVSCKKINMKTKIIDGNYRPIHFIMTYTDLLQILSQTFVVQTIPKTLKKELTNSVQSIGCYARYIHFSNSFLFI